MPNIPDGAELHSLIFSRSLPLFYTWAHTHITKFKKRLQNSLWICEFAQPCIYKVFLGFFFFFLLHCMVCGFPWPGIKPAPLTWETWNFNHWTAKEVPGTAWWFVLFIPSFIHSLKLTKYLISVKTESFPIGNSGVWQGKHNMSKSNYTWK